MPLQLDTRQRAMLQEMGVQVWLPGTAFTPQPPLATTPTNTSAAAPAADPAVFRLAPAPAPAVAAVRPPALVQASAATASAAQPVVQALAGQLSALDWGALADVAASCQACGLCAGRKLSTLTRPATPGQAHWLVVGDPPDEDEDRAGAPFVEDAGVLLDNMLKAVGASRSGTGSAGAHLSNVVKCRPPQGRVANSAELAQCAMYLQREIALVKPRVIVAMGRLAIQVLLSEQPELAAQPMGKLRGSVYRYQGVPVVVTYHPKVLLRASADKGKAWADLCLAMDVVQSAPVNL
jgi:uracil-DNA glycosylase